MIKSYVTTTHGQVHVRTAGNPAAPACLLVHWTPLSGRMWEAVGEVLAARGWFVVAPDLLGYGRSDPRPAQWQVSDWAQSLRPLLDGCAGPVTVIGGHVGACVATELALAEPERVGRLVIDGPPFLNEPLREAFRGLAAMPRPQPTDPGIDTLAWTRTLGLLREYMPGFTPTPDTMGLIWATMRDYLASDFVSSAPVMADYRLEDRLVQVTQPVALLSAEKDTLAAQYETAKALLPSAPAFQFAGQHPIHDGARAEDYVDALLDLLERLP